MTDRVTGSRKKGGVLTAEAIDCAYSVAGEGPPLFLIHGIGAARNTWAKLMPLLTSYYTVVTYDLRGHGRSPGLNQVDSYTLPRLSQDLIELSDFLISRPG